MLDNIVLMHLLDAKSNDSEHLKLEY